VTTFSQTLLEAAVGTPSVSGGEQEVVEILAQLLEGRVDKVDVDEVGNLIAEQGHGPVRVMVLGHVDTVPGEIPVRIEDGKLHGRGSVDAKGPLCAALSAAAGLPEALKSAMTFQVIGAVGEEAPGSVGARHVLQTQPTPDLLVIAEPSGWDSVTLGYKGTFRMQLEATCASHHPAGPEPSASDDLVLALQRIREAVEETNTRNDASSLEPRRAFDQIQFSVLSLRHTHDGLTENASASVGFRLPPDQPPAAIREMLQRVSLPETVQSREGAEALAAVRGDRNNVLARLFRTAIRQAGGTPRLVVKTGTSDWNVVAEKWDVPTVAYGPGDAGLDHTPNEHLDLHAYEASVEVWISVLERLVNETGEA